MESEIHKKLAEIRQWQEDHQRHDDERFETLERALEGIPKREEMDEIVRSAMGESLLNAGKTAKFTLITIAAIVGSLVVIGGGLKWLLAFIGFDYVGK